jgi:hypothetical protein
MALKKKIRALTLKNFRVISAVSIVIRDKPCFLWIECVPYVNILGH